MKTKVSQSIPFTRNVSLLAVSAVVLVSASFTPLLRNAVSADSYQDRINAIAAQNAQTQDALNGLKNQASTYQDAISALQNQITTLQASIAANQAQQASLQKQIADAQTQIDLQKSYLANDIKTMYVDGTPSTLEVLATSKNLSDYVDKQEYRTAVQNKLQDTLKTIAALQAKLQSQKKQVDQLLSELQTQQTQLDSDRAQQQSLLSLNESQQSAYSTQLAANNKQIAQIQAERAAAIARISGSGGKSAVGSPVKYKNFVNVSCASTGYSYCWAGYDQLVSDPWGLGYAKECVHFTADWLARHGYSVPRFAGGGGGNANSWANYGTVVSTPQVGDVAYMPIAPVGHVGMVTGINGDGTVHITQINWPVGGYASEMDLYVTSGIQFIRFSR